MTNSTETAGAAHDSAIYTLCNNLVDAQAELDPVGATAHGVGGYDHLLTDFSPDGSAQRTQLASDTLRALAAMDTADPLDRIAADLVRERLELQIQQENAGERLRDVRVLGSTMSSVRMAFDVMARDTPEHWSNVASRLDAVPSCLAGIRASLEAGVARGVVAAERQALGCAEQAAAWSGADGEPPFFATLVAEYETRTDADPALISRMTASASTAAQAYAELGVYLRDVYAPAADPHDPVGADRYRLAARSYLGTDLDLDDAYAWGWEELRRLEAEMLTYANVISPGASIPEAIDILERDPARTIDGVDTFRAWNQDLIDRTVAELDGTHFDIAPAIRRCEAMIAPPGGAAAMYYTGPSEDLSRPGRTWYPTLGKTRFPLWREVSICYHEGVPGHHLQVAQLRMLAHRLSRYQTTTGWVAGHGEGWALYAERLMGELGYLDDPGFALGQLSCQVMRAVRVIVDIGMHLELEIPAGEANVGERWTPGLALPFVIERSRFPESFMRSEVDRYLGLPGQAISYKIGERVWLDGRAAAQRRHGDAFNLKQFHSYALDLGPVGLDQLTAELARY